MKRILLTVLSIPLCVSAQVYDFGDLPEDGFGPFNVGYVTKLPDGPHHIASANLYIGDLPSSPPDTEVDGQPNATATGDDSTSLDESLTEIIVTPDFSTIAATGFVRIDVELKVTNFSGTPAQLSVFADLDQNGTFNTAGGNPENGTFIVNTGATTTVTRTYGLPPVFYPLSGDLEIPFRLRLSTQNSLPPSGGDTAPDGEVEDHILNFGSIPPASGFDFGDMPDEITGTAPGIFGTANPPDYLTRLSENGPRHILGESLHIEGGFGFWLNVDDETDGQPNATATGDDNDGNNDEDPDNVALNNYSVSLVSAAPFVLRVSGDAVVDLSTNNSTGSDAYLYAWADMNYDGDFAAGELSTTDTGLVAPGPGNAVTMTFPFSFDLTNVCQLTNYPIHIPVRARLSSTVDLGPYGEAPDGEVVDHLLTIPVSTGDLCFAAPDYGDFPDSANGTAAGDFNGGALPDYRTTYADNGPYHLRNPNLSFAETAAGIADPEPDGQPGNTANGDNTDGNDDEGGLLTAIASQAITLVSAAPVVADVDIDLIVSLPITNTMGVNAFVTAWADSDLDGDFSAGEQINIGAAATIPGDGSVTDLLFTIPYSFQTSGICKLNGTYHVPLRVRISTQSGLGPYGGAPDGEVEDHLITMNLESSDFCPTLTNPSPFIEDMAKIRGIALAGGSLTLKYEDFIPEAYSSDSASPMWYLDRVLLGAEPTLTPAQLAAIQNGTSRLWIAGAAGGAGVSPQISIIDSPEMLSELQGLGITDGDLAPYLDLDSDGWSSLSEFAFGSNATLNSSFPTPSTSLEEDAATFKDHLGITYLRRTGGTTNPQGEYSADGITYTVEASDDLGAWTLSTTSHTLPAGLPTPPTGYEWTFERIDTAEDVSDSSFIRIEVK